MNDFTKEDLATLFHWGIERIEIIGTESFEDEGSDKLYEKLRLMIENYCDHDSKQYYDDIPVDVCNNCHMVIL
jgi:hypothetical protein